MIIVNSSGEDIKKCSVELSGTTVDVNDIKAGSRSKIQFSVVRDAHYAVTIDFVDGRQLQQQVGYVTPGFDYKDTIQIHRDRVEFIPGTIQKP